MKRGIDSAVPKFTDDSAPRRPAWFWWFLANVLALCFAVASWLVCLDVFGRPEVPRHYGALRMIGRIPELRRFAPGDAPAGGALDARGLHAKFAALTDGETRMLRARWLRDLIMNFRDPLGTVYIEGEFEIERIRRLTNDDFISSGVLIGARALVKPDEFSPAAPYPVTMDLFLPSEDPRTSSLFAPGDKLVLAKGHELPVVIGGWRGKEQGATSIRVQVVPLAYAIRREGGREAVRLSPPGAVRPEKLLPDAGDD